MIEHVIHGMDKCVYCGNIGVSTATCGCKQSQKLAKSFAKPISKKMVVMKWLGTCPKCGTMRSPTDITVCCKIRCINCGFEEDYQEVKRRLSNVV